MAHRALPGWGGIDADAVNLAAQGALAWRAWCGYTTASDHHYVFSCEGGYVFAAEVEAARSVGLRFHPARGSTDLGRSQGGLTRRGGPRRRAGGDRGGHRPVARPESGLDAAGRGRSVLAVLGERRAVEAGFACKAQVERLAGALGSLDMSPMQVEVAAALHAPYGVRGLS